MGTQERIVTAVRQLVQSKAPDELTFADVARLTGLHWTTIRRHVGDRAALRALAANEQAAFGRENLDTRTLLLRAAARLTATKGFQMTSLDEVAAEAGLTKGAVYWHFASKHDLLLELMQETIRKQLKGRPDEISDIVGARDQAESLARWLENELPDQNSSTAQAMLFIECSVHPDPQVRDKLRAIVREIVERTTEWIEASQKNGAITNLDPNVVAVYLQAVLNGLMLNWLIDPERVQPADWADQLAQLMLYGLQPRSDDLRQSFFFWP